SNLWFAHSSFHARPPAMTPPLSLDDALPILVGDARSAALRPCEEGHPPRADRCPCQRGLGLEDRDEGPDRQARVAAHRGHRERLDRKSTRLNSSHVKISYAVFCLKKKKYEIF